MAEKKENMVSYAMRAGLVLGVASSIFNIASWVVPVLFMQTVFSLLTFFSFFFCIIHFTKLYDQQILDREITYFKALFFGWYTVFFGAMIFAVAIYFFFKACPDIFQSLMAEVIDFFKVAGESSKENGEQARLIIRQVEAIQPKDLVFSVLWGYSCMGFFAVVFTSIFFRKKKSLNS